jgi:hypothetical protein
MKRNARFLLLVAMVTLSGCGGGSQQTPPPPAPIIVTLTTAPPTSLPGGGTASVAATVTNDTAGGGVTWSCTPSAACGSFVPTSTASGATTTYTAPAVAPTGGQVSIIATSVTDGTKNASASVKITGTATNASLNGHYVLLVTAATGNQGTSSCAASVIADGNGNITGGVEELISPSFSDQLDGVLNTSSYSIDPSGHGTMIINTVNLESLKFSFVLISPTHALIIEIDGDPGSGTMDMQQPASGGSFTAAQVTGNYSFAMDGVDHTGPGNNMSMAGTFAADGTSALTSGTLDINNGGTFSTSSFVGSFTAPDSNGRGTMHASPTTGAGRLFIYYIISPKVLRLLEGDNISLVGGSAYTQGAALSTNAALTGKFVYQHHGWSTPGRTVAVGQLSADGAGKVTTGLSDSNSGGSPTTVIKGTTVTGTYMISGSASGPAGTLNLTDAAGTSAFNLYLVDPTLNILDPSNASGGGGALLLHTDASIIGTGMFIPQLVSGTPSFSNNHGLNLINSITSPTQPNEIHLVGRLASDGTANFTGAADYGQNGAFFPNIVLGNTLAGTFAADGANPGHFTGAFTLGTAPTIALFPFIPPAVSTFAVSYYQASSSQALVIQTDTSADSWGFLLQQQLP